jgi:hypothetical protein
MQTMSYLNEGMYLIEREVKPNREEPFGGLGEG